ncbi:MAG TPA: hypothetical protein VES20_23600, partial [Bryobacteraceae bacterium]|nr:hypothetical protein [Bryobacteraceae bacterium]
MTYIPSNENRVYVGLEPEYGSIAQGAELRRIPAVRFRARQRIEVRERKDKLGTRTFTGVPAGARRHTNFELRTYLTSWTDKDKEPAYDALFRAALGGTVQRFNGGTIAGTSEQGIRLQFQSAHGLSAGQAVCTGEEIRFVTTIPSSTTVDLNAPFTISPPAGATAAETVTYRPGAALPSVSVLDWWTPEDSVQRMVAGAAVDDFRVEVNSDYHQFDFSGPGHSLLDSTTFQDGEGGATSFPGEPTD